jgi:uncharacterized membrane protein
VLIPFSSQVLGDYGGQKASIVVYSVNLAAVVLVGLWMTVDARRRWPHHDRRRDPPRKPHPQQLHRGYLPALDSARVPRAAGRPLPLAAAVPGSLLEAG